MTNRDPIIERGDAAAPALRRPVRIAVLVVGLILLIGGFLVWRIVSGFGSATDAASAVPSDADAYINVDLASFIDGQLMQRLANTFPDAFDELASGDSALDEMDRAFFDEFGMTLSDDVVPWLGRSAGIGVWDVDLLGGAEHVMLVLKVRDAGAADAFIEELAGVTGGGTIGFHEGIALWEITLDGERGFAARVDDVMIASQSSETLDIGIDTKLGLSDSIQQNPQFIGTIGQLPDGPGMAMIYLAGSLWDSINNDEFSVTVGTTFQDLGRVHSLAAAVDITEVGLRVDGVADMDPELASAYNNDRLDAMIDLVPADAFAFAAFDYGPVIDLYRDAIDAETETSGIDLEAELGFDPITDGIDLLDGSFVVIAVPGRTEQGEAVGVSGSMGVTAQRRVQQTIATIADRAREAGVTVTEDGPKTEFDLFATGIPITAHVADDRLAIAWNTDPVRDAEGPNIRTAEAYRRLGESLGGTPGFYVDIAALVDEFDRDLDSGERSAVDRLSAAGATWSRPDDGVVVGSFLLEIDWLD